MLNKLTAVCLPLLLIFTVFCTAKSCSHLSPNRVKFAKPPTDSGIWQKKFVVWPQLPVRVRVKGSMWEMITSDANRAIEYWNDAIGCRVLEPSWEDGAEIVISLEGMPDGSNWAGSAKFTHRRSKNGDYYWGSNVYIHVLYVNDQALRDNIISHELGHALGYDDLRKNKNALMYYTINEGMYVDEGSLKILNELYCGGE